MDRIGKNYGQEPAGTAPDGKLHYSICCRGNERILRNKVTIIILYMYI